MSLWAVAAEGAVRAFGSQGTQEQRAEASGVVHLHLSDLLLARACLSCCYRM